MTEINECVIQAIPVYIPIDERIIQIKVGDEIYIKTRSTGVEKIRSSTVIEIASGIDHYSRHFVELKLRTSYTSRPRWGSDATLGKTSYRTRLKKFYRKIEDKIVICGNIMPVDKELSQHLKTLTKYGLINCPGYEI